MINDLVFISNNRCSLAISFRNRHCKRMCRSSLPSVTEFESSFSLISFRFERESFIYKFYIYFPIFIYECNIYLLVKKLIFDSIYFLFIKKIIFKNIQFNKDNNLLCIYKNIRLYIFK